MNQQESEAERQSRQERQRDIARAQLQDLVAPTIAAPFDPDATYAVSGRRLNRVLSDFGRADAFLEALEGKATAMERKPYAVTVRAHRSRIGETCQLLIDQAALTPAVEGDPITERDPRLVEEDLDIPPRSWDLAS